MIRRVAAGVLVLIGGLPTSGWAQAMAHETGPQISSHRVVGMGGAFAGVGEGLDGLLLNPASLAQRTPHTADRRSAFELVFQATSANPGTDFQISAVDVESDQSTFGRLGVLYQQGPAGTGLQLATYSVASLAELPGEASRTIDVTTLTLGHARAFDDAAWIAGATLRLSGFEVTVDHPDDDRPASVALSAAGLQLGGLWAPPHEPYRAGASLVLPRLLGTSDHADHDRIPVDTIAVPMQLILGGSYLLGGGDYNRAPRYWTRQDRQLRSVREDWEAVADPRYTLISADVVLTGTTHEARSAMGVLGDVAERSGDRVSLALRGGAESEVLHDRLRVRGGTYWEPSRVAGRGGRPHLTTGFSVRTIEWIYDWELHGSFDIALRYRRIGVGLGVWR